MNQVLRLGMAGPEVVEWQRVLGVSDDGVFGPVTAKATKAWQEAHGLSGDGVVGPLTWQTARGLSSDTRLAIKGTDIAFPIQGELPEDVWRKLAEDGVRFAIMRLLVGNEPWSDLRQVERQLGIARDQGIACGAYFFALPLPHLDPRIQVENFVRLLGKLDGLGSNVGDLPPAFDMEWPPREERAKDGSIVLPWRKWNCTADQIRDWCLAALDRGEELTGGRWIAYSFRYWLKCIEAHKAPELGRRPLWLADYKYQSRWVTRSEVQTVSPPAPWSRITIVQHDGNGGLRLPNGVDADFNMFVGDEADLDKLVGRRDGPRDLLDPALDQILLGQRTREMLLEDQVAEYRKRRIEELPA